MEPILENWPPGHFYSVIPNISKNSKELSKSSTTIITPFIGLDFHDDRHLSIFEDLPHYLRFFDQIFGVTPFENNEDLYQQIGERWERFHYSLMNESFEGMDARLLFYFLQKNKPKRIIEIGCGNSTLLLLNTKKMFGLEVEITCIEPFPNPFIKKMHAEGHIHLMENNLQDIELTLFSKLEENDILFIDSSHVGKYKSDVLFYFLEIFPLLRKNVLIHIHDIFFPYDYPQSWLKEGRFWNEQYFLFTFLQYNTKFSIVFGNKYCEYKFPDQLKELQRHSYEIQHGFIKKDDVFSGGSLWLIVETD
uniref:Methyltransferase n=1 Tax=viral metagenome TaxID=1070528 RepID=A0A6C0D004_9ZZZZ